MGVITSVAGVPAQTGLVFLAKWERWEVVHCLQRSPINRNGGLSVGLKSTIGVVIENFVGRLVLIGCRSMSGV